MTKHCIYFFFWAAGRVGVVSGRATAVLGVSRPAVRVNPGVCVIWFGVPGVAGVSCRAGVGDPGVSAGRAVVVPAGAGDATVAWGVDVSPSDCADAIPASPGSPAGTVCSNPGLRGGGAPRRSGPTIALPGTTPNAAGAGGTFGAAANDGPSTFSFKIPIQSELSFGIGASGA